MTEWRLVEQVAEISGPEGAGVVVELPAGRGPKIWRVTFWRVWGVATRVIVYLRKRGAATVWTFDHSVGKNHEPKEVLIPIPPDDEYSVVINFVAFRETPGRFGYRIEEYVPLLPEGRVITYTTDFGFTHVWPAEIWLEAKEDDLPLLVTNVSDAKCTVSITQFTPEGYWHSNVLLHLMPYETQPFTVHRGNLANITIGEAETCGYVVIQLRKVSDLSPIEVESGDEIKPDDYPWVGSLGFEYAGLLLTNAHVCPNALETVYLPKKGNRKLGIVRRVAKIRTVSRLDILLNALLNVKLPTNLLDVSAILPARGIRYRPFRDYPARVAEPKVGMIVYSKGRTSGERTGVVKDVNVTLMVPWPHEQGRYAIFADCIMIEMLTQPGDSGSLVVSDEGIVGLIFAGTNDGKYGFAIKAQNIVKWLGAEDNEEKRNTNVKVRE